MSFLFLMLTINDEQYSRLLRIIISVIYCLLLTLVLSFAYYVVFAVYLCIFNDN